MEIVEGGYYARQGFLVIKIHKFLSSGKVIVEEYDHTGKYLALKLKFAKDVEDWAVIRVKPRNS